MAVRKIQRCTRAPLQKPIQRVQKGKAQQKKINSVNENDKKAVVIAQEIKFARLLSSNDKVTRNRVLKNLRKWLTVRSQSSFAFTELDFMRLWKGLFYCMWMSDKPLIQEELAESLSKIIHCFKTKDVVFLYTTCALRTLGTEWFGIDQYRLDKFCMLVRRIIRQTFQKCKENSWDVEWVEGLSEVLEKLLVDLKICIGFSMHITGLFLEELSKISNGDIPENVITELVKPFITYFIAMDDERQIRHVMRHIFRYLIIQSDVGMDYMEKFKAWRDSGFPAGSIDAMEKIELSDEEMGSKDNETAEEERFLESQMKNDMEKPLDPRAGRVNVELPQIPFNAKQITVLLEQHKFHPSSTTRSRRQLRRLIKEFTELSQGRMPLGIKELDIPEKNKKDIDSKSAAIRLLKFEEELYSDKPQKRRKRKRNGQLMQIESDKFSHELDNIDGELDDREDESNSIDDGNENNSNMMEVGESATVKKKRKIESKLGNIDNLTNSNRQTLEAVGNGVNKHNLKKQKRKVKEETQDKNICKVNTKESNCKLKKKSLVLNKSTEECREVKSKNSKATAAKVLNLVAQAKRKKLAKLKASSKWDISDDINPPTPLLVNSSNIGSRVKIIKNLNTGDYKEEINAINKQPSWLMPVLTKLENKKNLMPLSSKGQCKISDSNNSKKRVKIALQRNTAQHTSEYMLQIRKSPAIPFDANKKPLAGVLKASPIPSPINPFYRRNVM